ncbi:Fe(3+) ABC transporter substrate-binding protein [Marivirga sp. S37H4]|uniref:Fe(3+) ABC transporter substrate-binding protein n=1 Tax=Marivirga aurantiaca TaxID=2802615 RepID=A0A935CAW3_9BACT|nr:Fe(3+) ABC transporter substrate-binding protein [Marivirga aurantiaca]MBK6266981.1 Fe(3+) ABC transporter substrate-binding protein [Marivirga aurantiaca]
MKNIIIIALTLLSVWACSGKKESQKEVNVYTHRHYEADQQLFADFEEKTGIKVNVVSANADELIQKMTLEGENSPADVLITVDAGRLHRAKSANLLQPIQSEELEKIVPSNLRDVDNQWFGLTYRGRAIVYNPETISADQISTYEALGDEAIKGRLLIRSSSNIYNQSLLASIVAHKGEEEATEWAKAVVENLARNPKGGDRDQIKAIVAGEGDVAVSNTYYLGKMLNSSNAEEVEIANAVKILFPNQDGRGTHINVSGAGVAKYAPNKENAVKFIEFLVSEEAQKVFAGVNYEYPVNEKVEWAETLKSWGEFKADSLNLSLLGENNEIAVKIFDRAGWK